MLHTSLYARVGAVLLFPSAGCSGSGAHEADATLAEAGEPTHSDAAVVSDAGPHDAASDATPSDASGATDTRLAQASAQLTQIRPRTTVGPGANTSDLDAQTAWWPIMGSAIFRTTGEGVDLVLRGENCRTAYSYPAFIYANGDCRAILRDSAPWERGMLKSKAVCIGAPGASVYESRSNADPLAWSLGGPAASNLVGRAVAIHDPDTREPLACGVIEAPEAGVPFVPLAPARRPSNIVAEQLGGFCGFALVPTVNDAGMECPDGARLSSCLLTHCIGHCLDVCADHVACLERSVDRNGSGRDQILQVCSADCERPPACETCLARSTACMGSFCAHELGCNPPPTPDGPCAQFRECCMRQGPVAEGCLQLVELTERLSGDLSCMGALSDHDINNNFTYRSPCFPDAGMDAGGQP